MRRAPRGPGPSGRSRAARETPVESRDVNAAGWLAAMLIFDDVAMLCKAAGGGCTASRVCRERRGCTAGRLVDVAEARAGRIGA